MNKPLPPHVRTESSTGKMMTDVLLAFIPLGIFSFVNYGVRPVLILLISILSAMLTFRDRQIRLSSFRQKAESASHADYISQPCAI